VTPHPGEAGRLLELDGAAVQRDRPAAARQLARATGATVVLKGARTLIARGDGLLLNDAGDPRLGTAGSGDVLAGMIAALLARDALVTRDAAALAVALHARLPEAYPARGALIATDLIEAIPEALRRAGL
jgi:NAD(P)H-hydrate epimerase